MLCTCGILVYIVHLFALYSEDPPSPATVKALQGLLRLIEGYPNIRFLDTFRDLKLTNMEYVKMAEDKSQIENTLDGFNCISCPQFLEHVCLYKLLL